MFFSFVPIISEEFPLVKRFYEKFNEETSIRILRFLVLDSIEQRNVENRVVLETVESVYVDFNYPEEMNTFISYMPIEDEEYNPSNHTQEDNERRLVEKFNMFLESELKWLNTQFGDHSLGTGHFLCNKFE